MTPPHPPDEVLTDFVLGKLLDPEDSEVESHLTGCSHCQARATTVSAGDTFVQLLTAAGTRAVAARAADATPDLSSASQCVSTRVWTGASPAVPDAAGAPPGLVDHPRYRLVRRLGAGGMGDVWLAEHAVMGRAVALKVIRPEFLTRPGAVERFRREVRAVAALHHPNIATAFDADEAGGTHFLVMEYVPGETLLDAVARGPLAAADACRAARDAARGLAHAHAAGLTHRDVKPSNLIRAADGTTKVLDFGLVGTAAGAGELTGVNMVMGTPDYIAPEQATDARAADARSDVYALGCTLYHLLAGRVPFPADSTLKKLDAHRDPARTPEPVARVPAKLARVLARMTAKDPAARYQTAEQVADALGPFCVTLDEDVPTAAAPARSPKPRRRLAVAGALLALLAVAAGGVVYKVQRDNQLITVETDDPDIEVVMRRNGELVRITDTKTKQSWELDTKKMRLKPDGGELSVDVPGKDPLTIRRNGDVAVTIRREPAPAAAEPIPPAAGELRRFGPGGHPAIRVAVSADGRRALTAGTDGTGRYWDVATGKELLRLKHGGADVFGAAITRDGLKLLTCGDNGLARVWDAATGKEVRTLAGHQGTVHDAAVAPNGELAATAGQDGTARLWNPETGEAGAVLKGHTAMVAGVAFAPDGKRLATWSLDGTVRLWEVAGGKPVFRLEGHTEFVRAAAFSADGTRLVSGSFGATGSLKVWDPATGKLLRSIDDIPGGAHGVAVSADGRRALSGGHAGVVQLWDLTTGREVAAFPGHARSTSVTDVAYLPGERTALSVGGDATVRVWTLPDPGAAPPPADLAVVRDIPFAFKWQPAWSADGARVVAGGAGPAGKTEYAVFDAATGKRLGAVVLPTVDRQIAHFAGGDELLVQLDSAVGRWNWKTGQRVADVGKLPAATTAWVRAVSADGKRFAASVSGGGDGAAVIVSDAATGREVFRVRPRTAASVLAEQPRFSPDGALLLTADHSPTGANALQLRKADTGELVRTIPVAGVLQGAAEFGRGGATVSAHVTRPGGGVTVVETYDAATGRPVPGARPAPVGGYDLLTPGRPGSTELTADRLSVVFVDALTGAKSNPSPAGDALLAWANAPDGRHVLLCRAAGLTVVRLPDPPAAPPAKP